MSQIEDFLSDKPSSQPKSGGDIDSFLSDAPKSYGLKDFGGDLASVVAKGVMAVPQAAVGLADIATGGRAGKALEDAGVRFKEANQIADSWKSDALKAQQKEFQDAEGIGGKAVAALSNPGLIASTVAESIPSMFLGGALAKGAGMAIPALAGRAGLAAAGEGAVMAGSQAENIRQQTADGLLTPGQSALAAATGVAGGAIGALGARAGKALGVGDIDSMIANGATQGVAREGMGLASRVGRGALSEGVLEELPQSLSETAFENVALDKPVTEGMDEAAVLGTLSGGLMGGVAGGLSRPAKPSQQMGIDPNAGPLSRAAAASVDSQPVPQPLGASITGTAPADLMGRATDPLAAQIAEGRQQEAADATPDQQSEPVPLEQRSLDELRQAFRSAQDPAIRKTLAAEIRKRREAMPDPLAPVQPQQEIALEPQASQAVQSQPQEAQATEGVANAAKTETSPAVAQEAAASPASESAVLGDAGGPSAGSTSTSATAGQPNKLKEARNARQAADELRGTTGASTVTGGDITPPSVESPLADVRSGGRNDDAGTAQPDANSVAGSAVGSTAEGSSALTQGDVKEWSSTSFDSWKRQGMDRGTASGWTIFYDHVENTYRLGRKVKDRNEAGGGYVRGEVVTKQFKTADEAKAWAKGQADTSKNASDQPSQRPDNWRGNAIKAGKVARSLGLDPKGKRLKEIVAEIDAMDSEAEAPARRKKILDGMDGMVGSTRKANIEYVANQLREDIEAFSKMPFMDEAIADARQKLSDYEAIKSEAISRDDRDLKNSIQRTMLIGARDELKAAVQNGEITQEQADETVEQARATGNAAGAVDAIEAVLDSREQAIRNAWRKEPRTIGKWTPISVEAEGQKADMLVNQKRAGGDKDGALHVVNIRMGKMLKDMEREPIAYTFRLTSDNRLVEEGIPTVATPGQIAAWKGAGFALDDKPANVQNAPQAANDGQAKAPSGKESKAEGGNAASNAGVPAAPRAGDVQADGVKSTTVKESSPVQEAAATIKPSEMYRRLQQLSARANRKPYTPLTEEEFKAVVDAGLATGKKWATGKLNTEGYGRLAQLEADETNSSNARADAEDLIAEGLPFKASAVDQYGLAVPEGYVRQGEMFAKAAPAAQTEPDYLKELFGVDAKAIDADPFAVLASAAEKIADQKAKDIDRIRESIKTEKARAKADYDDWAGRVYKRNKTQIDLRGDGPSNQASMSVGSINESRRRNAMEALSKELAELEKLEKAVATDEGAERVIGRLNSLMGMAQKAVDSRTATFKTVDEQFQYMLLDSLEFRGPGGKGNITSNGLSKAMLNAVKAQPKADKPAEPYDAARAQELRNSIAEGELILSSGKSNGKRLTAQQLEAVRKSVDSSRAKLDSLGEDDAFMGVEDQTQTEAFKKWFGDSKVVDDAGKPLRVFHGSRNAFTVFDYSRIGQQGRAEGAGFYFTNSKDVASGYGAPMEVFLSIKKPLAYDAKPFSKPVVEKIVRRVAELEAQAEGGDIADGFLSNFGDVRSEGLASVVRQAGGMIAADETALDQLSGIVGSGVNPEFVNRATSDVTGFDGVVAKGFSNAGDASNSIYVAFFPEQIKSATGNRGTFDPANPDITFAGTKDKSKRQVTPVDRAIMDMAGEGREANEILSFIAKTSKSPYRRQLAQKLLATGANPAVSLGGEMGGGAGFRFLAKYSRKNHEVTLSEAAADRAEQIFLHETVHSATLLALDKGGLFATQMRRLAASVYKNASPEMRKMYGLVLDKRTGEVNVGEFVAEAFTNPDFQKALKGMKADNGSLWDRLVNIVRRILGIEPRQQDALSKALELGAGVMRENIPLRAAKSFRAEDGPAFAGRMIGMPGMDADETGKISSMSLTRESARDVRLNRIIASQSNPADKARMQGFIDFMTGAPSKEDQYSKISVVSYLQGRKRGQDTRDRLKGAPWIETEKKREGGKWIWAVYQEGYWAAGGEAKSESAAEEAIIDARVSLREKREDSDTEYMGVRDQTETPEFKRWFAGSKVVDSAGKPLVVWHGSRYNADIKKFSAAKSEQSAAERGIYFTDSAEHADQYASQWGDAGPEDGGSIYPVYLKIQNPYLSNAWEWNMGTDITPAQARKRGHDGYVIQNHEGGTTYIAFRPEQIKSATGNRGTFDPEDADIAHFGIADASPNNAREAVQPVVQLLNDTFKVRGKIHWWHKTVGTPFNLAERVPEFKRVFNSVQDFINSVSFYGAEAAAMAPKIIPKLESWKDLGKSPIKAEDNKAIATPIFEGTLSWRRGKNGTPVRTDDVGDAGIVWSDDELRSMFKLNDEQIGLYREFRSATDKSLTDLALSDILQFAGKDAEPIKDTVMGMSLKEGSETVSRYLKSLAEGEDKVRKAMLFDTANSIKEKADKAQSLMDRGYAPLQRFGRHTLYATNDKGEQLFFGMYEDRWAAARAARQMREQYPGAKVEVGMMSEQSYKLFQGISPETLELFGTMLGLDPQADGKTNEAFQTYLKLAKSNRSALKRLIERKGISGYSEDASRVLASFIYSNARQTASNLHVGEIMNGVNEIPRDMGEAKDAAVKLARYTMDPQEEAQALRGLLFAQYLGGSIASAAINALQPAQVTFPYLSQFVGAKKSASLMTGAVRDAIKKSTGDPKLDAELRKAEEEGIVSPQEIFQLMAQAQGKATLKAGDGTKAGDAMAAASNTLSRLSLGWGKVFSIPEQFNRRTTFIAAYRTAKETGEANPYEFAKQAVKETQLVYNKGNRPEWARGTIGALAFTFKTYSISYVELLQRMAASGPEGRRAALLMVGVLFIMAGAGGLPGVEDAEDVVDGIAQRVFGLNFQTRQKRQEWLADTFGEGGARFIENGLSGLPWSPTDVSGRLGLGNLIPGTGLFVKKEDYGRDVAEIAGPAADMTKRFLEGAGLLLQGEVLKAGEIVSPTAVRNMIQGGRMLATDQYTDTKGRKVIDTTPAEGITKLIGFQPADVARVQEATGTTQRMIAMNKIRESEIADKWAKGLAAGDADVVQEARDELRKWNESNPESPIRINMPQLFRRVRALKEDKATRIARTAPKEIRQDVRRALEQGQ